MNEYKVQWFKIMWEWNFMSQTLVQLDFFKSEEECRMDAVEERMKKCEESCGKVRRKLFATNGEMMKMVLEMDERLKIIERNICKNGTN